MRVENATLRSRATPVACAFLLMITAACSNTPEIQRLPAGDETCDAVAGGDGDRPCTGLVGGEDLHHRVVAAEANRLPRLAIGFCESGNHHVARAASAALGGSGRGQCGERHAETYQQQAAP